MNVLRVVLVTFSLPLQRQLKKKRVYLDLQYESTVHSGREALTTGAWGIWSVVSVVRKQRH